MVPVFWFVPKGSSIVYPEAIVTSFLCLVSYRAHCGAIVAVFISEPKHAQDRGGHKTVMHRKATIRHNHSVHCSRL